MFRLAWILSIITQLSLYGDVLADEECRLCQIENLLQTYQSQHSVTAILNEKSNQFCNRNFVKSVFYCSSSTDKHQIGIGTVWGSNLVNDLAISVILNRTLVVEYRLQDCGGYISPPKWIITHEDIIRIATEKGCPLPSVKQIEPLTPCFQCFFNLNKTFDRIINLEPWYWQSVYYLYHPHNGGVLTSIQRDIYNLLYSNPTSHTSFEAAGILLEHIIEFTDKMKQIVHKVMEPLRNSDYISISMHLRHQDGDADKIPLTENKYIAYDHKFVKCFHEIRRRFSNRKCVLYIASDRPQSLNYVTNRTANMDCEVRTAPRDVIKDPKQFNGEHGPWSGATSILDVYILSYTDWFIGSHGSSYSLLINNLVMRNNIKRNRFENPLYEVTGHEACRQVSHATACSSQYRYNPHICSSKICKDHGVV